MHRGLASTAISQMARQLEANVFTRVSAGDEGVMVWNGMVGRDVVWELHQKRVVGVMIAFA